MAITPVTALVVAKKGAIMVPPMATEPLTGILNNLHYLWQKHTPPLLSVVYNTDAASTRNTVYHIPIMPSVDSPSSTGLKYKFEHRFCCSAASQTVAVTVDETDNYAGAGTVWTQIYTQNVVSSGTPDALTTSVSTAYVIPADAVALRITLASPAVGTKTNNHLLVYPAPDAPAAGVQTSGFKPFDDGIMASADKAPIHEEWIQRAAISARAVAEDRRQCAFAFVQEYTAAPSFSCTDAVFGNADAGYVFPTVRAYLPHASGPQTLFWRAIGEVTAGSNSGLIRIGGLQLDADGAINGDSASVNIAGDGLQAHVDLGLSIANTSPNTTRVFAVVAFWTPQQPQDNILIWQPKKWPTAQAYMLGTAANRVESVAIGPYVGTAHLFNGQTTGLATRYLGAVVAPGAIKARASLAQCWDPSTDSATPTYSEATSTSGGAVATRVNWTGSGHSGTFGTVPAMSALIDTSNGDGAATGDVTLSLTQANAPATEPLTVSNVAGASFYVSRQIEDWEAL